MKNLFKYVLEILRCAQDDILSVIEVMKFFNTPLIKAIDAYTIEHEPVASIDLMERAARALTVAILERYAGRAFAVFAGPGNNGGDGLVIAANLKSRGADVKLLTPIGFPCTDTALQFKNSVKDIKVIEEFDGDFDIVIDALFGIGLNNFDRFSTLVNHNSTFSSPAQRFKSHLGY